MKYLIYELSGKYKDIVLENSKILSEMISINKLFCFQSFRLFVEKAINDKNVELILLIVNKSFNCIEYAALNEISAMIHKLKANNIEVHLYSESYNVATLILASDCDRSFIHPCGYVYYSSLYKTNYFFKDILEKVGIVFNVYSYGQYKNEYSSLHKVQSSSHKKMEIENYVRGINEKVLSKLCSKNTNINPDIIQDFSRSRFVTSLKAVNCGLIDVRKDLDDVISMITARGYVIKKYKQPKSKCFINFRDQIKLIFLSGLISNLGNSKLPFGVNTCNCSEVISQIRKASNNRRVKAVIFRIDSKGGDVCIASKVYKEILKLRKKKPVVVSLGNYCTSAAYWVASAGTVIFSNDTTIFGSIGTTMLFPDVSELIKKMKIGVETHSINPWDGNFFLTGIDRGTEYAINQYLKEVYEEFIGCVLHVRKLDLKNIKHLFEGQIIPVSLAKSNGLIDCIGNLEECISFTKEKYNLNKAIISYENKKKNTWLYKKILSLIH